MFVSRTGDGWEHAYQRKRRNTDAYYFDQERETKTSFLNEDLNIHKVYKQIYV